jgi:hypothetical protein
MFWKAQQVAASDPGAWQRFMESNIGKQAQFNAQLFEAQARFGAVLGPIRLFAYEVGTVAIGALTAFGTAMKIGVTESLQMTFTVALPAMVKLGVGNVLLLLGQMVGAVSNLLGKLGIDLGGGLAQRLTSFGTGIWNSGSFGLAQYNQWRDKSMEAVREAMTGSGTAVDMSPIVFPNKPGGPGGDAPLTKAQLNERLALLLALAGSPVQAADSLRFQGLDGPISTRDDRIDASGSLFAGTRRGRGSKSETPLDRFEAEVEQRTLAVDRSFEALGTNLGDTLAGGFSNALQAGIQGKNPFKAFGSVVLAGLGSIMQEMGKAMIAKGIILLKLLPFLSNPFTSGPALIAAGIALTALGATLGGIATGGGGGSGGGAGASRDRTTQITLTADGAGGFTAPKQKDAQHFTVIGASDPRSHRIVGEITKSASRRNIG